LVGTGTGIASANAQAADLYTVFLESRKPPQPNEEEHMRGIALLGVVLIVAGLVALLAGGFSYTDRDTTELGPIDVTVSEKEHVRIPTAASIGALVIGVVLLASAGRKRSV
jgi:hypothetical protein